MIWQPGDPQLAARLRVILESWRDTPWVAGQCCKGVGVDCVRFVAAVLDELCGTSHARTLPRLPQDLGVHDAFGAAEAAVSMVRKYPHEDVRRDGIVRPADVIAVTLHIGLTHTLIVGPDPSVAWHAVSPIGVTPVGLGHLGEGGIGRAVRVWRPIITTVAPVVVCDKDEYERLLAGGLNRAAMR